MCSTDHMVPGVVVEHEVVPGVMVVHELYK
jgi:hypothetical protein